MHATTAHLAAGDLTGAIGVIPASGIALILVVTLGYGVVGKGRKKLASGPAQAVGMFAELAFLRADSFWRDIGEAMLAITSGLAGNSDLGTPGPAVICVLLVVLSLFARIVPASGAVLGLLMGAAFHNADGSLFLAVVSLFSVPFGLLGA